MRENNDIDTLFRTRLKQAEMDVRDGFWDALKHDLDTTVPGTRIALHRYRWIAIAASVVLVASVVLWLLRPTPASTSFRHPLASAPAPQADLPARDVSATLAQELPAPSSSQHTPRYTTAGGIHTEDAQKDKPMSVHVSITISQRLFGHRPQTSRTSEYIAANQGRKHNRHRHTTAAASHTFAPTETSLHQPGKWALKASAGTSLPKKDYHAPFTIGMSAERRLTPHLALEAGLQYNRLAESEGEVLHTLGIPVRLNILLAQAKKVDFYALVGGTIEKCVAGGDSEPIEGSVLAGLGVSYKLNNKLALFAEPYLSHHFVPETSTRSLRTERPLNMNLLCGLRMTY